MATVNEKMTAIADSIRAKTGGTEKLNLDQMASAVGEVYDAGYAKGQAEGGGTTAAYDEGFEAGKKAEYDAFWDAYQENGNKIAYQYAFSGVSWNDETFKPKYDIKPSTTDNMFSATGITDLVALLEKLGISIDFSNSISTSYIVQNSSTLTTFPIFDARKRTTLQYFVLGCDKLRSFEKVILKDDGTQTFSQYSFWNLPELEEIRFEGVIGRSGINLKESKKLSKASIENIISCLSTTTSEQSITLSKTAKEAAFTTDEWAALIATRPNWTISIISTE